MLIIGSMHLISVQSWTSTSIPRLFTGTRLPKQISRLLEEEIGEEGYECIERNLRSRMAGCILSARYFLKKSTSQNSLVGSPPRSFLHE